MGPSLITWSNTEAGLITASTHDVCTGEPEVVHPGLAKPVGAGAASRDAATQPVQRRLLILVAAVLVLLVGGFVTTLLYMQHDTLSKTGEAVLADALGKLALDAALMARDEGTHSTSF